MGLYPRLDDDDDETPMGLPIDETAETVSEASAAELHAMLVYEKQEAPPLPLVPSALPSGSLNIGAVATRARDSLALFGTLCIDAVRSVADEFGPLCVEAATSAAATAARFVGAAAFTLQRCTLALLRRPPTGGFLHGTCSHLLHLSAVEGLRELGALCGSFVAAGAYLLAGASGSTVSAGLYAARTAGGVAGRALAFYAWSRAASPRADPGTH